MCCRGIKLNPIQSISCNKHIAVAILIYCNCPVRRGKPLRLFQLRLWVNQPWNSRRIPVPVPTFTVRMRISDRGVFMVRSYPDPAVPGEWARNLISYNPFVVMKSRSRNRIMWTALRLRNVPPVSIACSGGISTIRGTLLIWHVVWGGDPRLLTQAPTGTVGTDSRAVKRAVKSHKML